MKAYQMLQAISPSLSKEILTYLNTETRDAYRTALYQVAAQRRLRPQYLQQKTRDQQAQWLLEQLKVKAFDGVGEQLLQLWLLKAKTAMLNGFLDAAGVKHDGKGQVDDLPEEITAEQAAAGVDAMLKDNPGEHVAVYLHLFQTQREGGWPTIADELEKRPELKLAAAAA
jgi:hypothetical protein